MLPIETNAKVAAEMENATLNIAAREKEISLAENIIEKEETIPAGPVKIRKKIFSTVIVCVIVCIRFLLLF